MTARERALEDHGRARKASVELAAETCSFVFLFAGVAELADALDSKSSDRKIVWVRSPPPAFCLVNRKW
jgi:hypothetical protein